MKVVRSLESLLAYSIEYYQKIVEVFLVEMLAYSINYFQKIVGNLEGELAYFINYYQKIVKEW